jgi:hypothetical protein
MSRRKNRRQRSIPQQKALSNPVADLSPTDAPHPQPLIFFALAEEYGGLDSPQGTDWGEPSMPPVGTAQVMGTQ